MIGCINTFGTDWKVLENNFEGRSQNQIKNRYFGRLKKLAEKKLLTRNGNNKLGNDIRLSEWLDYNLLSIVMPKNEAKY